MAIYKPRHIKFKELLKVNDWSIKVYTITKQGEFDYSDFYSNVKEKLPEWLAIHNGFNAQHNHIGFLILHAGTEGIFTLINWWVGDNMLNTHIFKSNYDQLDNFEQLSGNGLAPCIWELEIINHERLAWIDAVLKLAPQPNYKRYLDATINVTF
ncbi:hypothetical protein [Winogradskyella tangerina]|uniref:hypothetical protein n=1 Tax=Winogradskyella tangerina TaxID=2023240 RepID=UPI000DBE81F6|nr:hypothetical protein [Winogradskyella tangerina]